MNVKDKMKRLNLIENVFLNYEFFAYMYVVTSIVWFFPFLGPIVNPICKMEFIWGILLLIYDFFLGKRMQKNKSFLLLVLFLISYTVTIIVNIEGQFYMGIKHLLYSAIAMLLLFNVMNNKNEDQIKKFIMKLNYIIIIISMIGSLVSIIMYFFSISIEMEYMGNYLRQGFIDHRLFGIYTSANTGATMAILSVAFGVINNYLQTENCFRLKKWAVVNLIIQMVYFSLTLSRGGKVTLYVMIAIYMVFIVFQQQLRTKSTLRAIVATCVLGMIVILGCVGGMKGIQKASMSIATFINRIETKVTENDKEENQIEEDNEIKRIESGDDMSNGRFTIWSAGISVWEKAPLFGVADVRIDNEQLKCGQYDIGNLSEGEIYWLNKVEGNLHNSYIQILVNSGIVGFILFAILATYIGIEYLQFLFNKKEKRNKRYYVIAMIFTVIVSMLVNCCFENRILFDRQNPFGFLFWIYLGIGYALIRCEDEGEKYNG